MMVLESDYLPVGTLHIVTCTGAKLGRENCDICIPDLNVSKVKILLWPKYLNNIQLCLDESFQRKFQNSGLSEILKLTFS
jgi:hypothetical protein